MTAFQFTGAGANPRVPGVAGPPAVTQTAFTPLSTASRITDRAAGPSSEYTWSQSGWSVSAAIAPTGWLERLLTTIAARAAAAPRAVSSSPCGWNSPCAATGPTTIGANNRCPNSSVDRSSCSALTISFWRNVIRSNGARLPPASFAYSAAGSTAWANASNSCALTSSPLGGNGAPLRTRCVKPAAPAREPSGDGD